MSHANSGHILPHAASVSPPSLRSRLASHTAQPIKPTITPIVTQTSATLKTGKLTKPKDRKSVTEPADSLSIMLPTPPPATKPKGMASRTGNSLRQTMMQHDGHHGEDDEKDGTPFAYAEGRTRVLHAREVEDARYEGRDAARRDEHTHRRLRRLVDYDHDDGNEPEDGVPEASRGCRTVSHAPPPLPRQRS